MDKFKRYLQDLAVHEDEKSKKNLQEPRKKILVNAGIRLNWLGDYFANPKIKWEEKILPIEKIQFTGTSPKWNKILTEKCGRSVKKFKELLKNKPNLKKIFEGESSFGNETILVRVSEDKGMFKVLDGMHRFVGAVLKGDQNIKVFVPINEKNVLPICEEHVVYDLIRGFMRNAKDRQGKTELYYALTLLLRTYGNVEVLLKKRFNKKYVHDDDVQDIIKKVLKINKNYDKPTTSSKRKTRD